MSRSVESAQQNALFSCKGSPGSPICDYWTISGLLFLPAAGALVGGGLQSPDYGYVVSRSAEAQNEGAWLRFTSASVMFTGSNRRWFGVSIRLVCLAQ